MNLSNFNLMVSMILNVLFITIVFRQDNTIKRIVTLYDKLFENTKAIKGAKMTTEQIINNIKNLGTNSDRCDGCTLEPNLLKYNKGQYVNCHTCICIELDKIGAIK